MTIHAISPKSERTRSVRKILIRCLRHQLQGHGGNLAGFALVTWDMCANAETAFLTGGHVSRSLVPAFTSDALNRHIAVELAQDRQTMIIPPDDDPAS
jgi:hypothetical protein